MPFSYVNEAQLVLSKNLLEATKNGARLHGFSYDDPNSEVLSNVEIIIDDKDKIKKMARNNKPKKIEEIEENISLSNEGK